MRGFEAGLHELAPRISGLQFLIVGLLFARGPSGIVMPMRTVARRRGRGRSIVGGGRAADGDGAAGR